MIAQLVKNLFAMPKTLVWFLGHSAGEGIGYLCPVFLGFPCGSAGKESTSNAGDLGLIPGLGKSPGEGKGYPPQYSGLENSMDCIVHRVAKSWTQLSDFHFLSIMSLYTQGRTKMGKPDLWGPHPHPTSFMEWQTIIGQDGRRDESFERKLYGGRGWCKMVWEACTLIEPQPYKGWRNQGGVISPIQQRRKVRFRETCFSDLLKVVPLARVRAKMESQVWRFPLCLQTGPLLMDYILAFSEGAGALGTAIRQGSQTCALQPEALCKWIC